jgi:LysR family transcriptional regulator, glycine cleavage system transcriptional activator
MIETERAAQPRPASRPSGRGLPSTRKRNTNTTAPLLEES